MEKFNIDEFSVRNNLVKNLEDLKLALEELPPVSKEGPWIAGGSIRRLVLNTDPIKADIDFFFKNENQCTVFIEDLKNKGFLKKSETKHAISFEKQVNDKKIIIQAVKINYYESLEDCLESFDFTICQCGFDGENLIFGSFFLWDLGRKKLAVNKITFASASVRRMIKYADQGFTVCEGCITSILNSVVEDPSLINKEIQYVD